MNRESHAVPGARTGGIARALAALDRWNRRRLAIRDLRRIDTKLLADVGVERERIAEIVDAMLGAGAKPAIAAAIDSPIDATFVPATGIASTPGAA